MTNTPPILDGHNDVLLQLYRAGGQDAVDSFIQGREGAIDLPNATKGGFAGGFFAVYVPSPSKGDLSFEEMNADSYDLPLPEPIGFHEALPVALEQVSILREMERRGALKICTSTKQIEDCINTGIMAAIMHIEGAEAIDSDLFMLDVLHAAGLRSIGPVWSRSTIFGHGVPFRFPSDPDIGEGLTEAGRRLIKRCNELKIMVDLSHLNAKGFWDVAELSDAPLVATHSNCCAITPHSRNLTDDQLRTIKDSGGMVGLNLQLHFCETTEKCRLMFHLVK